MSFTKYPLYVLLCSFLIATSIPEAFSKKKNQLIQAENVAQYKLISDLFNKKKYREILPELEKIEQSDELNNTERAYIHNFRGNVFLELGTLKEAQAEFKKILNYRDGAPKSLIETIETKVIANLDQSIKESEARLPLELQAIKDASTLKQKASAHWNYGRTFYLLGRFSEAVEQIKKAIELHREIKVLPESIWYGTLSVIHRKQEQFEKHIAVQSEFSRDYPSTKNIVAYASAYALTGRYDEALDIYIDLYKNGKLEEQKHLRGLATLYIQPERYEDAARFYEELLAKQSLTYTPEVAKSLSTVYHKTDEQDKLVANAERAYEEFKDKSWLNTVALAYYQYEQWDKVEAINIKLIKAYKGEGSDARSWLHTGVARYHLGNKVGAKKAFKKAKKSEMWKNEAQQWLNRIKQET